MSGVFIVSFKHATPFSNVFIVDLEQLFPEFLVLCLLKNRT